MTLNYYNDPEVTGSNPEVFASSAIPNHFQNNLVSCEDWTIRTDTLFLSHSVRFRLNEPGKDTTMDGRKIEFVIRQTDTNR